MTPSFAMYVLADMETTSYLIHAYVYMTPPPPLVRSVGGGLTVRSTQRAGTHTSCYLVQRPLNIRLKVASFKRQRDI